MWVDHDIDGVMKRTAKRPIPSGRVPRGDALALGLGLSGLSVDAGLTANWVAAALLAGTIFFYAVVYSMWLKRTTHWNTVAGGVAGALPPVIGWAAATGSWAGRRWRCSRFSSRGSRRISGRSPCSSSWTTTAPGSRC